MDARTSRLTSEQVNQIHSKKLSNEKLSIIYSAIEHARNGIIITDHLAPDEPIIYCNKAFLRLTGYKEKEIIGQNCRFLQGKERNQAERFKLKEALAKGKAVHVQIRNYRKDGTMFWNDLLMSPIKDRKGKITHFSGNQLDVTKKKLAEEQLLNEKRHLEERVKQRTAELNEIKEYLESIVETIRQPLLVLDGKLHVISANTFFYKTFKVKAKETEGKSLFDLGNNQWDIPNLRTLLKQVLPKQNPFEGFEVEHDFPTIGKRTMVLNAKQVELKGSGQERILLAIEDISERRGAEVLSQQSQALTQAILNSLNAHIAVLDRNGVIIEVNEAWKTFAKSQSTSTEEGTYLGQNYLTVLKNSKGDKAEEAPLAYAGIKKVMQKKLPHYSLEYPCFTPDKDLWFLLQVTPLKSKDGGVVVAHIDITERKQTEIRKDDFISMASHELKTPITSMKLNVQTLQKHFLKKNESMAYKGMTKVDTQIKKLTRLVNELLDVSRIYAGKLEIQQTAFDIDTVIENLIEDFKNVKSGHIFVFKNGVTKTVYGDPDRVEQVIINLFTNAMKYSPPKTKIRIKTEQKDDNVIIRVKDSGIGIPQKHAQKVFERFYQVTDPGEKTYPGLGMGLYISRQIILRHGGEMWVDSKKGQGAEFFFTLPLAKTN